MFGPVCPLWRILTEEHTHPAKIDRVLWAGNTASGNSPHRNKDYLSRHSLFNSQIRSSITPVALSNQAYMHELSRSMFALDMNGEGDPNYRTFELLTTDALISNSSNTSSGHLMTTIHSVRRRFIKLRKSLLRSSGVYAPTRPYTIAALRNRSLLRQNTSLRSGCETIS